MDADDLQVVYTLYDENHAEVIRGALESEGIRCRIDGEHQAGMTNVFEVKLLVRAGDYDRARKIIESHEEPRK